jgi:hypothetical protein
MFIVSTKRRIKLVGFTIAWLMLFLYTLFGFLGRIIGSTLTVVQPYASPMYANMADDFMLFLAITSPVWALLLSTVVMIGFWFVSAKQLAEYVVRRDLLRQINECLSSISSLSSMNGCVVYNMQAGDGSYTMLVSTLGGGDYRVDRFVVSANQESKYSSQIFGVDETFFGSSDGHTDEVMEDVLNTLVLVKEHGVQHSRAYAY